jgi:hypothetical protein
VVHNPKRAKLTLSSLTISGGKVGIVNDGTLTVNNCAFSGNSGAIVNWGRLSVENCVFSDNSADTGAAIGGRGTGTVTNTTFYRNSVSGGGFFGGGAIYINGGNFTVTNCVFSDNSASAGDGGAIYNVGRLTVTNSTFSDNSVSGAANRGGAMMCDGGSVTVTNSTFSGNNQATIDQCFTKLRNTILANNLNCANSSQVIDRGNNIDSGTSCGFTSRGSLSNTNPQLDPAGLANNGGPTQTIALQAGSPAINVATCFPKTDQRGYKRPGIDSMTSLPFHRCTIGACEFNSPGCPSGQTECGTLSVCTNLQKDPNNCGSCSNACTAGQKCSKGTCL